MTRLIVFSHLRWGFVYQRPQHLMSRLASRYQVLFFEEPVRSEGPARLERVVKTPNLEVLVPHTAVEAPGFHDDQLSVLKPLLSDFLREQGIDDYLVWFYTPMALPLIAQLRPRAVVYDCMDELAAFKDAPRQLRQRETALMKLADVMLAGGPALYESKRTLHDNLHCLPSSVNAAHFAPSSLVPGSAEALREEQLQGGLPSPCLGYYGVIDERFDVDLLRALAQARPDWAFVMVGPVVKIDPARLPVLANIHWLGMQSYEMLPYLMARWDVCLMPFALNESTRFISPTKTLEYLAGEKPIVSTPVHDVVGLYGEVVAIASSTDAFLAACEAALAESGPQRRERIERSLAVVRRSSWDRMADTVLGLLAAATENTVVPAPSPAARRELAGLSTDSRGSAAAAASVAMGTAQAAAMPSTAGRLPRHVRHLVIGAGPTGLAAAYHLGLGAAASDTVLLEREEEVGGWCRSVVDRGYTFDRSGEVMSSNDPYVHDLYDRLLGDNVHRGQIGPNARSAYPMRGGLQALMDGFLPLLNCELALKTSVLHVSPSRRTVRLDDGRLLAFDSLISTMPLPLLVEACGDEAPLQVQRAAKALHHGSVRNVNLGVQRDAECPALTGQHCIPYPEGAIFHRIVVQGSASPHNDPPGGFGLTCEISYSSLKPLPCEGQALIDRVIADCRKVGIIGAGTRVPVANQIDVPCAHLVYDHGRSANVAVIRNWLASFGILIAGRYGEWEYAHSDHAFVTGRKAAEQAMKRLATLGKKSTSSSSLAKAG